MLAKYYSIISKKWVAFSGEDARAFLHGQLSSDVKNLQPLNWHYSSYSTPKGRMLGSFIVYAESETRFLVLMAAGLVEPLMKRLKMFVMRSKVHIEALNLPTVGRIGLGMPPEGALFSLSLAEDRMLLVFSEWPGACPLSSDENAWTLAEIDAGIPWVLPETLEAFVPQTANMELIGAVHFKKGCYPGQEIVARVQYLGVVKRRLMRFEVTTDMPLKAGITLFSHVNAEETRVVLGHIMNVAHVEHHTYRLLAVILKEGLASGVFLEDGTPLMRLSLPYAIPDWSDSVA